MENPVIIFGAKGIALAALEIFQSNEVVVYGFLDDDASLHGQEINGVTVLGATGDDGYLKLIGRKAEAFVAVDENAYRKGLVKLINERRKKMPVNAIHRLASIPESVFLGHGNFINAGVVLGAGTKISNHCILNSGVVIDHEASLGDFVQVGAGSVINMGVTISNEAFIGSGVTIVAGVNIGQGARVGAGAVVIADVPEGQTVFGNPATPVNS